MVAIAVLIRSIFILAVMAVVAHKAWPGEMLDTPLARLTLGTLFLGLIKILLGFSIEGFLVWRLVSIPTAEERKESAWEGMWIWVAVIGGFFLAFPFWFIDSGKKNVLGDLISGVVLSVIGWLVS